jgi:hypothetical protein
VGSGRQSPIDSRQIHQMGGSVKRARGREIMIQFMLSEHCIEKCPRFIRCRGAGSKPVFSSCGRPLHLITATAKDQLPILVYLSGISHSGKSFPDFSFIFKTPTAAYLPHSIPLAASFVLIGWMIQYCRSDKILTLWTPNIVVFSRYLTDTPCHVFFNFLIPFQPSTSRDFGTWHIITLR